MLLWSGVQQPTAVLGACIVSNQRVLINSHTRLNCLDVSIDSLVPSGSWVCAEPLASVFACGDHVVLVAQSGLCALLQFAQAHPELLATAELPLSTHLVHEHGSGAVGMASVCTSSACTLASHVSAVVGSFFHGVLHLLVVDCSTGVQLRTCALLPPAPDGPLSPPPGEAAWRCGHEPGIISCACVQQTSCVSIRRCSYTRVAGCSVSDAHPQHGVVAGC
jgi:hypothetical protein